METQYHVWIYKQTICAECGNKTVREPLYMNKIPDRETVNEIIKLLKQCLKVSK